MALRCATGVLVALLVAGCATPRSGTGTAAQAYAAAVRAGFVAAVHTTPAGPVRTLARGLAGARVVDVYIEGDGQAWRTRTRPSRDPTPREALALALARADPAAAVLYLARPCQYASAAELARCEPRHWTVSRYGEPVIAALDAVVDAELAAAGADSPALGVIGYSGGAVIATLLAARRADVAWTVAVAGNLDPAAWVTHHGVSALDGIDPRVVAARDDAPPQVILLGAADTIVPPAVVARYLAARDPRTTAQAVIDDYDHRCCWAHSWPALPCRLLTTVTTAAPALCALP